MSTVSVLEAVWTGLVFLGLLLTSHNTFEAWVDYHAALRQGERRRALLEFARWQIVEQAIRVLVKLTLFVVGVVAVVSPDESVLLHQVTVVGLILAAVLLDLNSAINAYWRRRVLSRQLKEDT